MRRLKLTLIAASLWLAHPASAQSPQSGASSSDAISPESTSTSVETSDPWTSSSQATPEITPPTVPTSETAAPAESGAGEETLNLAALGISEDTGADANAQTADLPLNFYGFADFSVFAPLYGKSSIWSSAYTSNNTRALIGNLNLYMSRQLFTKWSMLAEVRFHYLPAQNYPDPADSYRGLSWGGIEIERAHVDYDAHQWFKLRMGSWLTPYGIWNVDHGTPTLIAIRRPFSIGEQLFPERQTGFLAFGGDFVGPVRIGYQLGVSNGRGPRDTFDDLDQNKGITARLEAAYRGTFGEVRIGITGYKGRYTNALAPTMNLQTGKTSEIRTEVYDEVSFGGDLQYDFKGFVFRGEYLLNQQKYNDAYRPRLPAGFMPDNERSGFYGLAGYRIPTLGLMPYVLLEGYTFGPDIPVLKEGRFIYCGLNYQISPRLVAKAEYVTATFPEIPDVLAKSKLRFLQTQLAWAF